MRGVNKTIILGCLGNDPELKVTQDGTNVCTLSVATSETWKDKQTGQQQERTEWHRIVFFNRLAEIAGQYLRKGSKVYIEGSLRTRKWQAKDGSDRYTTEIIGNELQMLDNKQDNQPAQQATPAQPQAKAVPMQQPAQQPAPQGFDDFMDDSDIPFSNYELKTLI